MEQTKSRKYEDLFFAMLLVFSFCLYFFWALRIWKYHFAPDEAMRYEIPMYIYNHWKLPVGDDPEILNSMWGISYAFYPILSYMIGGLFMKIVSFVNSSEGALLMAARLVSVISGTLTVFWTIRISRLVFRNKPVRFLLPVAIAVFPELVFVNSYVNNDAFAIMTTAMIVYYWLKGDRDGWTIRECIGLSVGIGLCTLSYFNAYGFPLMSIFLFFYSMIVRNAKPKKEIIQKTVLIVVLTLAICGWWFVRNYFLYDGDFLGRSAMAKCAELHAMEGFKPSDRTTPMSDGVSLLQMLLGYGWISTSIQSFIAVFGVMDITVDNWIYILYKLVFVAGVYGLFCKVRKNKYRKSDYIHYTMIFMAIIIPIILSIYYSYCSDYQAQGRYCLPAIIPLFFFLNHGIDYLEQEFTCSFQGKCLIGRKGMSLSLLLSVVLIAVIMLISFSYIYLYKCWNPILWW